MMKTLSPVEKRALELRKAMNAIGGPKKTATPAYDPRAFMPLTPEVTQADLMQLKRELLEALSPQESDTADITLEQVKQIVRMMHSLPENDKLEISKGVRNAQSFIFGGTKYGMHEMMHGAGSAATGGFTVLPATGTIDDSNVTFTFTEEPGLININGGFYQSTGGSYTWVYVAGTVTLSAAVGTGGSIFGII